jgi:hypothetical protein
MNCNNFFYDYFVFCSDLENYRGEGILANKYIETLTKFYPNIIFKCHSPNLSFYIKGKSIYNVQRRLKSKKVINFKYFSQYIIPFFGICLLWINFFKKKKLLYINFLPLWNFLIFFLCPPRTIFGPITGSIYKGEIKNLSTFVRKIILPMLCKLSIKLQNLRGLNFCYSTDLLKNFLAKNKSNHNIFNFQIRGIKPVFFKENKKYDFLIYYRKYFGKNNEFILNIIKFLIKRKYKVIIVGDEISYPGSIFFGTVTRKKMLNLLKATKYVFNPLDNFYSMFFIDSYNSGVKIFYDINQKPNIFFVRKNLIPINFQDIELSKKKITRQLSKKFYFHNEINFFKKNFFNVEAKQNFYFKSLL